MSVYERHTLSNGLRVLTAPLGHAQSVACYVMLAAGSRYENASNRGIAHFAEHMFFKGTERRPTARDIAMEVDSIGGEFNAFTSKEYTGYYIRCAGERRDQAFDVLVDMLRNSKFDSEELEREKGVIIEEMNMYVDTPRDYIGSVYEELLFGIEPARLGDARDEGDDRGRVAGDVPRLPRRVVQPSRPPCCGSWPTRRTGSPCRTSPGSHVRPGRRACPVVHCLAVRRADDKGSNANARLFTATRKLGIRLEPGSPEADVIPELDVQPDDLVLQRYHGIGPMGGDRSRSRSCATSVSPPSWASASP